MIATTICDEGMSDISELLPQASPMVLLSGYTPPKQDTMEVEAYVDVSESSPFYERESGGVPGCVSLEYMAQTMALFVGIWRRRRSLPPKIGFVLGSRRMTVAAAVFKPGERLLVRARCSYQDESFASFDCTVSDLAGATLASAQLSAFQPDGEIDLDKMEEMS